MPAEGSPARPRPDAATRTMRPASEATGAVGEVLAHAMAEAGRVPPGRRHPGWSEMAGTVGRRRAAHLERLGTAAATADGQFWTSMSRIRSARYFPVWLP